MIVEKDFRVAIAGIYQELIATTVIRERIETFQVGPCLAVHWLKPGQKAGVMGIQGNVEISVEHVVSILIKPAKWRRRFTTVM